MLAYQRDSTLAVCEQAKEQKPRVRLAMPTGFTKLFTANLPQLQVACPGLSLELLTSSRPVDLKKGEADLAIRSGPVIDEDLVARRLCETGWSLYASPAYLSRRPAPADPNDLSGHDVSHDHWLRNLNAARFRGRSSGNGCRFGQDRKRQCALNGQQFRREHGLSLAGVVER